MQKRRDDSLTNFLPISRKYFNHPFWREKRQFSKFEAWLDLIQSARFEESEASELIGGRLIKWQRGQMPASLRFLGERWAWSKNKVDDFLHLLEREKMISRIPCEGQTIICLLNYESYNGKGRGRGQPEGQQSRLPATVPGDWGDSGTDGHEDSRGTAGGQPGDKTNSKKNLKNGKEGEIGASAPAYTEEERQMFDRFQKWILANATNVSRMREPFTIAQYLKLRRKFSKEQVQDLLMKMHNWKPLLQKNNSAFLTISNWAKKDFNTNDPSMTNSTKVSINEKLKAAGKESGRGRSGRYDDDGDPATGQGT